MVTQFGDRLGVPEAVGVSQCLLQGPGEALAQREEVQSSLDLLLLLLGERLQLMEDGSVAQYSSA